MLPGPLIGSSVNALVSRVIVNGIQRDALAWSIDRDIVGDLPTQVVAAGGVAQASGSITWASQSPVTTKMINPWNASSGWIPVEGDRVQIIVGDGVREWTRFVGVIGSSSGDNRGGLVSEIIDRFDDLSAIVNIPALANRMPPLAEGDPWRRIGLSNLHYINTAMRNAGFYTTPGPEFGCVLDAPMQGSMWPLIGDVRVSRRLSTPDLPPVGQPAPWGASRSDTLVIYEPHSPRSGSSAVQLTLMRTAQHNGVGFIRCSYGDKLVELRLTPATAWARINGVPVASVPFTGDGTAQVLLKGATVTVATSSGASASAEAALGSTAIMGDITVSADADSRIAGAMVSHPTQPWHELRSVNYTPTARINVGTMHAGSVVLPAVTNTTARDLLDDIGGKLLRPFWINEEGVLMCIASDVLRSGEPVQNLTTLDDLRTLSWSRNLLSVRSEVRAKYLWPAINARQTASVTVFEGSSLTTLLTGDTEDLVIEPGANEDWGLVDDRPLIAGLGSFEGINKGIGSLVGGIYTDGVTEEWASTPTERLTSVMQSLGANKWVLKSTAKTLAAGKQVALRTVSSAGATGTTLYPYWWDRELPLIRAKFQIKWTERERTPTIAGSFGPTYEHDFGPWATGEEADGTGVVDMITSFIAEQVTSPSAVINSMRVGFDPRRQLGDVITVSSPNLLGVTLRCLITAISDSAGPDGFSQVLSVRIISARSTYTTYSDFAHAWGPAASYDQFAAAWATLSTYEDFNRDPLRGTH